MSHEDPDWQVVVREQRRMFRLAERDYGLTRATLHLETGIPASTLKSYANDTLISLPNLRKLARVIPDDLTSLLFMGTDKCISTTEPGDGDVEAVIDAADEVVREYVKARSDKSPGGSTVVPMERAAIVDKTRKLCSLSQKVAAA